MPGEMWYSVFVFAITPGCFRCVVNMCVLGYYYFSDGPLLPGKVFCILLPTLTASPAIIMYKIISNDLIPHMCNVSLRLSHIIFHPFVHYLSIHLLYNIFRTIPLLHQTILSNNFFLFHYKQFGYC